MAQRRAGGRQGGARGAQPPLRLVRVALSVARLRDEAALRQGLAAWLARDGGRRELPTGAVSLRRPTAGYANETLLVEVDADQAGLGPGPGRRFVVRLPPLRPLFPRYDLARQAAVHELLARRGLPTPAPVHLEADRRWLGTPFLVMPFVEGHVVAEVPALDPWLAAAPPATQRALHDRFVDLLAELHRLGADEPEMGEALAGAPRSCEEQLSWWEAYLRWVLSDRREGGGRAAGSSGASESGTERTSLGEPPDALLRATRWCRRNLPSPSDPASHFSLLWGDARLGNLVVDEAGAVRGALDWELAGPGAPESDLAWYLVLDEVAGRFVGRPEGFPAHDEIVGLYEQRLGRPVEALGWHEVFALVRATAVSWRQGRLEAEAEDRPAGELAESHPLVVALAERLG